MPELTCRPGVITATGVPGPRPGLLLEDKIRPPMEKSSSPGSRVALFPQPANSTPEPGRHLPAGFARLDRGPQELPGAISNPEREFFNRNQKLMVA